MSDTPPHTPVMVSYSMRRKGERKRSPLLQELMCAYASSSKEPSSSDYPSILPTSPPITSLSVEGEDADPLINPIDENEHSYYIASNTRSLRRSTSCPLRISGSGEESLRFKHLLERLAGEYERDEVVDEILESSDPDGLVREFFEFVRETDEAEIPSNEDGDDEEDVTDEELGERRSENDVVRQNDGDGSGTEDEPFLPSNLLSSANPFTATEYEIRTSHDEDDWPVKVEEETVGAENNVGQDTFSHVSDPFDLEPTDTMVVSNIVEARLENVQSDGKEEKTAQDDASRSPGLESNPFDIEFQHALASNDLTNYETTDSENKGLREYISHFDDHLSRYLDSGPLVLSSRTNLFEDEEGHNPMLNDDGSDPFADLEDSYPKEESAPYLNDNGSGPFADPEDYNVLPDSSNSNPFTDALYPSETVNANPFAESEEISPLINQVEEDPWSDTCDWPPNPFKDFFCPDSEPVANPGSRSTLKISSFAGPNPFSEAVEAMSRARTREFGENVDTHPSSRVGDTKGKEKEECGVEGSDISPPLSLRNPEIDTDAVRTNPFQDPQEEYPYEVGYFSHAVPITEPYGPYLGYDSVESFSQTVRSNPDEDPMNYYIPEAFWQRNEGNPYEDPTSHQVTESFSETVLPISEPVTPRTNYLPTPSSTLQKPQKFKLRNPWCKKPESQPTQSHLKTSKNPAFKPQPAPETTPNPQLPAFCSSGHTHAHHAQHQPTLKLRVRRPPSSPETAEPAPAKFPLKLRIKGTISRLSARILPPKQRIPLPVHAELTKTTPAQPRFSSPTPQEAFLANPTSYRSLQRRIVGDYLRLPAEVRYSQDYGDELRYEEGVVSGEQTVRRRGERRRERYRVSERRLQGGRGEGWRGKYRMWWEDGRAGWGTIYRGRGSER